MASTGPKVLTSLTGGVTGWTNCTVARLDTLDGSEALAFSTTYRTANLLNFGFSIPSTATITGIEVIGHFNDNNAAQTATLGIKVYSTSGGGLSTIKTDTVVGTTVTAKTFGSSSELWGNTWIPSDFDDASFLLEISLKSSNGTTYGAIDYLTANVYYTLPASSGFLAFF